MKDEGQMTKLSDSSFIIHPSSLHAKLGHVCTAEDPLIAEMLLGFHAPADGDADERTGGDVRQVDTSAVEPLRHVIAVGGSFSSVPNVLAPQKVLGFVKVAAAAVD